MSKVEAQPAGGAEVPAAGESRALILHAGSLVCALRIEEVVETLRPLPTEPLARLPPFVRGVAVIRGHPLPVVDLGSLLGAPADSPITRFVVVRAGERRVALAVSGVVGLRMLPGSMLHEAPPLAREACGEFVDVVGALDDRFLAVLRSARILPPEAWQALEAGGALGKQP